MENTAGQTAIIASDIGEFFAPTQYGAIDMLLSEHGKMRERIERLAELVATEGRGAVHFFAKGGRLGAILPASLAGRELVNGAASHEWSEPMSFDGVSIKVCRYVVRMPA